MLKDIDLAKGVEKEASRKGNVFQRALKMGRKRYWWENVNSVGGKQCSLKDSTDLPTVIGKGEKGWGYTLQNLAQSYK